MFYIEGPLVSAKVGRADKPLLNFLLGIVLSTLFTPKSRDKYPSVSLLLIRKKITGYLVSCVISVFLIWNRKYKYFGSISTLPVRTNLFTVSSQTSLQISPCLSELQMQLQLWALNRSCYCPLAIYAPAQRTNRIVRISWTTYTKTSMDQFFLASSHTFSNA